MRTLVRQFPAAALLSSALALALGACAQSPKKPPEARLGNGPQYANAGNGSSPYGEPGGRRTLAAPGTPEDFAAQGFDVVLFQSDSSELTPEARQALTAQAGWLARYPHHPVMIEGHADERGTREYNIALGGRRAAAVRSFLISQGVPAERLRSISFGKERPVVSCNDISCWSRNRRAHTVLHSATIASY